MTVRIAQISDSHLSPAKPFFRDNFDRVSEHLRQTRPDIVINTGDLALDGADHEGDLVAARDAHEAIGLQTHLIPGNHDVGDHPDVATRQVVTAERLARYRRVIGPDFWSIDLPGWRIIGLNALIIGHDLPGEDQQRDLVAQAAATLNGRALALVVHKPLADESYAEALTSNRFLTEKPRQSLLACLGAITPPLVLCGHVHQYRDTRFDGSRHIWAPATSFMISDPWQPAFGNKTVGYLMHAFHPDGTHEHRLIGVRGLVHHDLAAFPDAYGDVRNWGPGRA